MSITPEPTAIVPLRVLAALRHGLLATVRLSNDGWEHGDEHAAQIALAKIPTWLEDQLDAYETEHRPSDLDRSRCAHCGGSWPCATARAKNE